MKRLMYIILTALISTSAMSAQSYWSIQYNMGFPHGASKDFTDNTSFRGLTLEGKTFTNDNWAFGGFAAWNVFSNDVKDGDLSYDNKLVSGHQYRYLNSAPVMLTASYYPTMKDEGIIKPFITMGLGTIYQENSIELGTHTYYSDGWMFGLAPEVGVNIALTEAVDVVASYRYTYGFETSRVDALSYSNINLGLVFKL